MSVPRCPSCFGQGVTTGILGDTVHYRCRDCGGDWHKYRMRPAARAHAQKKADAALARMYPRAKR
jgi:transposase-like protein